MKLTIREDSVNYAATIVCIDNLHEIPGRDMIQRTVIYGNNVIISKEIKQGDIMVYFCSGTRLSEDYCYHNNLYTDKEKNKDKEAKPGYISPKQRRVKALKLAGVISDGFLMPVSSLDYLLIINDYYKGIDIKAQYITLLDGVAFKVGDTFTTINDVDVCEKYVVQVRNSNLGGEAPAKNKLEGVILDNQLRFHPDTEHFAKNIYKFSEDSKIVITRKLHGSSFIGSKILVYKSLGFKDKIAKFFGVNVEETEYGYVWSSGKPKSKMPKGIESNSHQWDTPNQSFYNENIWEKMYHRIKDFIEPGVTIYGELVGCFHYRTPILLSDGSTKEIGAIVTSKSPVEVLTYNIDRQVLEPKRVVAWYENGPTDDWYTVETKRRKRGGKSNKLTVTSNHKFFTEECGNVVEKPLSELTVGDVVYTQGRTLNRNQLEYIKGSLLGDGCFSDKRHYVTSHSNNSQQFYNDFISTFLEGTVRSSISGKGSDMSVFSSIAYPEIEGLYEELYSNKKSKEPTRKYLESLSNISLAAWYMDDGSFTEVKNERQFVCHLHTLGFTKESNEIICEFFNSRGYECQISKREKYYSGTKYCIQFTPKGAASFLFDISPYILKGFDYKIPVSFRNIPKINICVPIYEYDKSLLKTYITSIKRGIHYKNKDPRRFDIKVEGNSNYFANNILVHNSGIQGPDYTYGHELELYVYRITVTSPAGHVYEMSWDHVKEYCNKYDLKHVTEYFDGKVGDLVQVSEDLLEYLSKEYLNKSYPDCKIDEGICIRLGDEIFKLKSPKFLLMESDLQEQEIINIEDGSN